MNRAQSYHLPFLILIATLFLSSIPNLNASQSMIKAVLHANKSTVNILAESGGIAPVAAKPFIIQETGEILVAMAYRGVKYNRTGSGIILDNSGLIAANAHVVDQAGRITVTLQDNSSYDAQIVYMAPENDVAILKIKTPAELIPMELANSDFLELGNHVYLIGSSELLKNTLTEGEIMGFGESKSQAPEQKIRYAMIEINFELHKGDSGSPILSRDGECLGFVTAGRENQNDTYAVPSNLIKKHYLNYLKEHPPETK